MKKLSVLFTALFIFSTPIIYSQDVHTAGAGGMQFFNGTWSEVLAAAKEQNK